MVRKSIEVFVNAVFWIASAWLLVSGFTIISIEHTVENGVESHQIIRDKGLILKNYTAIALSFLLFYSNLYLLVRRGFKRPLLKTIGMSLGLWITAVLTFKGLTSLDILPARPAMQSSLLYGIFTFYFAISVAYALGIAWQNSENERKNLVLDKNKAELTLLRNQLQPHFLFNALNNLLSMLQQQQYAGVSKSIEKLAFLLRYVIEETTADKINLSQEIKFIENYASLQLLRFDPDEIEWLFSVEGDPESFSVEPGIFLPFIENAFKYGTEPERKSRIAISFNLSDKQVINFSISNPILSMANKDSTGTGIASTKNRLNIVYPNRYELDIEYDDEFVVRLKIFVS